MGKRKFGVPQLEGVKAGKGARQAAETGATGLRQLSE